MDEALQEFEALKKRAVRFEVNFRKCSKPNRTKGYLNGRKTGLDELWQAICEVDERIESFKDDTNKKDPYFEDDHFGMLEEKYYQIKGEIEDQLDAFEPKQQGNRNHNGNGQQPDAQSNVKLPKIDLPQFEGSYHTWLSFKNRFTNLIHNNKKLTDVEKLQYLNSCVRGKADTAIKRFQLTDENYMVAWDRLNEKYDNKRILQDTQVEMIIDRREIKAETAEEIRELLDTVQESLESLKTMEVDTGTWDPFLVVLVKRKLPFKTREEWEKQLKPADVPTYKELIDFLETRYRTVESLELVGGTSEVQTSYSKVKSKGQMNQRSSCPACNSAFHSIMMCEVFLNMSMGNRNALVNAKKLCRNCLSIGHMIKDCRSSKRCFKCNLIHHTLLHREDSSQSKGLEPNYSRQNFLTRGQSSPNEAIHSRRSDPNYKSHYESSHDSRPKFNVNHRQDGGSRVYTSNSYSSGQGRQCNFQSSPPNQQNMSTGCNQSNQPSFNANAQSKRNLTTIAEPNGMVTKEGERETLFPTAIIKFRSNGGIIYHLRALLDQCSEDVFIKESVAKMVGGVQFPISSFDVTGLEGKVTSRVEKATKIQMVIGSEVFDMDANVVPNLVGMLPKSIVRWPNEVFKNIKLADTNFATPNNVDIMLGTKAYTQILLEGVLKEGGYLAQNTKVGWIVSGRGEENSTVPNTRRMFLCIHTQKEEQTDEILKKFWEMEEAPKKMRNKKCTSEEKKCEQVFKESYRRLSDGRPQVRLPFKVDPSKNLGESRNQAVARWLAMERKLEKNSCLRNDYMRAIQEHLDLGHMERTDTLEREHKIRQKDGSVKYSCYYIPHHAVVKEESKTTKTRIVFDASAKTSSGKSLNEILMIGPTIQESLIIRLIKWRIHPFALRGDITKMYRQIKVYSEDVNYQRMVFRFERTDPIEDFVLNTLTFGTASAPYMAMRTLKQLAIDGKTKYPIGAKVVKDDFLVDDLLTGAETVEMAKTIWKEVRGMLLEAKFPMRKWSSNSNEVLRQIPEEEREFQSAEITNDDTLKALGIGWSPIQDYFFFEAPQIDTSKELTKRTFLSQAAKLFDPLGWLGPVVLKPKIMFQKMWKESLKWDDVMPKNLAEEWIKFRNELRVIEQIKVPRWFGWSKESMVELHGFSDASNQAYGAVIYIKTTNQIGNSTVQLVIAKSRVAPVKNLSLPKLELCGAVMLANLKDMVQSELQIGTAYCWTDSTITLDWINSKADKHKTFVANRIAEIQEFTKQSEWRHVEGTNNPADCLSRGLNPKELILHPLWWHGPSWLNLSKENWPKNPNVKTPEDQLELKGKKSLVTRKVQSNDVIRKLWSRYNSFTLLVRVSARIRTLKKGVKEKQLSAREIDEERMFWIQIAQSESFSDEINSLKNGKELNSKSKLLQFNPFLDWNGVLRIGGRLKEALIDFDSKHQIIIPKESVLARMIINDAHNITKHGGTQLTMAYTRTQYWIIDTRKSVRNQIHKCVICHRYSKKTQTQLMGNLPEPRVNMSRAFLHTGVDYAGPVQVLTRQRPGRRETTKGYVALFVCLCTKAIHLELVSNMTSENFLAALTRFRGRRGLPSDMYSDNSLTFIGAKNELDEDLRLIKEVFEPQAADVMLKDGIQWHFIPPHAPHWGGIWEAGVKSMKHHVRRIVGESVYTFEQITTMLVEVEAVLNSRPLCPVSDDPNDFSILTPGHFLIGGPLLSPPRPSLLDVHPNRLRIYKQISQRVEHFAKRWKNEYLSMLQHRPKWMRQSENVEVGDMVLVKDDNFPPSGWRLGRIVEVFPDPDGLVRSVKVRTETDEFMRPIHKISVLPIEKPIRAAPET